MSVYNEFSAEREKESRPWGDCHNFESAAAIAAQQSPHLCSARRGSIVLTAARPEHDQFRT